MVAIMDHIHDATSEFLTSGRTGRRNAVPDIMGQNAKTSTADLPLQMEKLSCSDPPEKDSASGQSGASTSQDCSGSSNQDTDQGKTQGACGT